MRSICSFLALALALRIPELRTFFEENMQKLQKAAKIAKKRTKWVPYRRKRSNLNGNITIGRESALPDQVLLHRSNKVVHVPTKRPQKVKISVTPRK